MAYENRRLANATHIFIGSGFSQRYGMLSFCFLFVCLFFYFLALFFKNKFELAFMSRRIFQMTKAGVSRVSPTKKKINKVVSGSGRLAV